MSLGVFVATVPLVVLSGLGRLNCRRGGPTKKYQKKIQDGGLTKFVPAVWMGGCRVLDSVCGRSAPSCVEWPGKAQLPTALFGVAPKKIKKNSKNGGLTELAPAGCMGGCCVLGCVCGRGAPSCVQWPEKASPPAALVGVAPQKNPTKIQNGGLTKRVPAVCMGGFVACRHLS